MRRDANAAPHAIVFGPPASSARRSPRCSPGATSSIRLSILMRNRSQRRLRPTQRSPGSVRSTPLPGRAPGLCARDCAACRRESSDTEPSGGEYVSAASSLKPARLRPSPKSVQGERSGPCSERRGDACVLGSGSAPATSPPPSSDRQAADLPLCQRASHRRSTPSGSRGRAGRPADRPRWCERRSTWSRVGAFATVLS